MGTDLQGEHTAHTAEAVLQPPITPALSFICPSAQNFIKEGETTEYSPLFHRLIGESLLAEQIGRTGHKLFDHLSVVETHAKQIRPCFHGGIESQMRRPAGEVK